MGGTATEPLLELDFLSHGTVLVDDLDIAHFIAGLVLQREFARPGDVGRITHA